MEIERSTAMEEARDAASGGPADRILERLVERIGGRASVEAVFGEPIQHGEVTVIPVARIRWGFGGGAGSADSTREAAGSGSASGSGGGGGVSADPVGYLEIGPAGATFRPIVEPYPSPFFLLASAAAAAIIIRALARLIRR